jgi:hypothetical protein
VVVMRQMSKRKMSMVKMMMRTMDMVRGGYDGDVEGLRGI